MQIVEFAEMIPAQRAELEGDEFAILFCHGDRAGLYERLGFEHVARPVLVEQEDTHEQMPMCTMWSALREGTSWPAGRLTVHSLPF
jgi:hypothetical protein